MDGNAVAHFWVYVFVPILDGTAVVQECLMPFAMYRMQPAGP